MDQPGSGSQRTTWPYECDLDPRVGIRQVERPAPVLEGLYDGRIPDVEALAEFTDDEFRVPHQTHAVRGQNGHPRTGWTLDRLTPGH